MHLVNHHGIESGLGERRHTEVRVHDDGLGLIVIARQAKAVGQVKSGQLLSPRIVEFARDSAKPNDIPIFVSRLGAGNRADPSGIRGIGVTRLLGQRHRRAAIDLDGDIVNERSPNAKCGGSVVVQGRAERVCRARQRRCNEEG